MRCHLILMRHAKSDHGDPSWSDHERPLNKRGRRDAPRMARWLAEQDWTPTAVLCSDATRTRETLSLMIPEWAREPEVHFCESLYLASGESILGTIRQHHGQQARLMVLGHNPGISELASGLTGQSLGMPTAAIAVMEVEALASEQGTHPLDFASPRAGCELVEFAVPKQLEIG